MKIRKRVLYPGASMILAIDPGLTGTGWALWHESSLVKPIHAGIVRDTAKDEPLSIRCRELSNKLISAITRDFDSVQWFKESTWVFIEMPQHFASSARGIAAQAGAVYTLAVLVGYLAAELHPCTVVFVTPNEWKGQLPKHVVEHRVIRTLGKEFVEDMNIRSHSMDAVGLGLWATGRLKS